MQGRGSRVAQDRRRSKVAGPSTSIWLLETLEGAVVERLRSFGYSAHVQDKDNRLVDDTDVLTTRVPDGDFIVSERPTRWLVRRVVGEGGSQTTWAFEGGEAPAVAQALIFARHDGTAAWLRVADQKFRLIQSFRP